ncbi:MAG: hypothetical protein ACE5GJ_03060 [Gemmatimonadota bacterium]
MRRGKSEKAVGSAPTERGPGRRAWRLGGAPAARRAFRLPPLVLLLAAAALTRPAPAAAQASLVPPDHPVYGWLLHQRAAGALDRFAYEAQPLSRGEVLEALRAVARREDRLAGADRSLLAAWIREFSPEEVERSAARTLGERWQDAAAGRGEPHLLAVTGDEGSLVVDGMVGAGYLSADEAGVTAASPAPTAGLRAYGNVTWGGQQAVEGPGSGGAGFHLEVTGVTATGDAGALQFDRRYRTTRAVAVDGDDRALRVEGAVSVRWKALSADVGHMALRYGVGWGEPLILSAAAPSFTWARARIRAGVFQYTALHGRLIWDGEKDGVVLQRGEAVSDRNATARWIAMHRVDIQPHRNVDLSFSEILLYSARGMDLAYVNPIQPLFFSELDNDTRDNALWAFEGILRPARGVELSAVVLVDDASTLSRIFRPERGDGEGPNPDRAYAFQGRWAERGWDLGLSYTRVEPWMYTYRYALMVYENRGFSLGSSLGPNADETRLRVRRWLSRRGWLEVWAGRGRKGVNPVQADGSSLNVGGSLLDGNRGDDPDIWELPFLARADVHDVRRLGAEVRVEPIRGLVLTGSYERTDITRGTRLPDLNLLRFGVTVGF